MGVNYNFMKEWTDSLCISFKYYLYFPMKVLVTEMLNLSYFENWFSFVLFIFKISGNPARLPSTMIKKAVGSAITSLRIPYTNTELLTLTFVTFVRFRCAAPRSSTVSTTHYLRWSRIHIPVQYWVGVGSGISSYRWLIRNPHDKWRQLPFEGLERFSHIDLDWETVPESRSHDCKRVVEECTIVGRRAFPHRGDKLKC